ncbi:MAG: cyclic nucleotide-binding domain-containing protein [Muribaculaceae bacterium]|nr:cyclic nucleotide-binding domain-containing protein [Muribaculaceae bacterium]
MLTMYETIMELPLFKGIGEEQLSQLLEKTSLEFLRKKTGEIIYKEGESVGSIDFVLSGRVKIAHRLKNFDIELDEILGPGDIIGGHNLFGLETSYPGDVTAFSMASIMRIEKREYMRILMSDPIYMLNFVNYLSAGCQRVPRVVTEEGEPSISRTLSSLIVSFMALRVNESLLIGSDRELARYCGVDEEEFTKWKRRMMDEKKISLGPRGQIIITRR